MHTQSMSMRERLLAVLEGRKPDKVPFFIFSELFPRGAFERELRNRGMGFMVHSSPVIEGMPHVSTTTGASENGQRAVYHTPLGDISAQYHVNTGRIAAAMHKIKIDSLIKRAEDYGPLISMIDDSVYYPDLDEFRLKDEELGGDGVLHVLAGVPPYTEAEGLLGLEKWSLEQYDNPKEFGRLVEALQRRADKRLNMIAEMDYPMVVMLGDVSDNIGPGGYMRYEAPFHEKYIGLFRSKGKKIGIHAHASLLKRQSGFLKRIAPDFIESYTPPPYGDLPLPELRNLMGEDVTIFINFPESVFYEGYETTRDYTLELLNSDPCHRKGIGFSEMGMMGVDTKIRKMFEDGFRAVADAVDAYRI